MSKTKLSRREREKNKHKEEILNAALVLFSEKGFYDVSMQEIAEASEFGVGTLYNFFDSKEALFEEIITRSHSSVFDELFRILDSDGTEKQRLSKYIKWHPKLIKKHGDVIKLFVSRFTNHPKLSKSKDSNEIRKRLDEKLAQLIKQGIDNGMFRSVDPLIAAKTLGAIHETLVFEAADCSEEDSVNDMFERVENLFLNGLLKE